MTGRGFCMYVFVVSGMEVCEWAWVERGLTGCCVGGHWGFGRGGLGALADVALVQRASWGEEGTSEGWELTGWGSRSGARDCWETLHFGRDWGKMAMERSVVVGEVSRKGWSQPLRDTSFHKLPEDCETDVRM